MTTLTMDDADPRARCLPLCLGHDPADVTPPPPCWSLSAEEWLLAQDPDALQHYAEALAR